MKKGGSPFIAVGIFLLIIAVAGAFIIKPAYDSGLIDIPNPFDTTYKPALITTFDVCKAGTGVNPIIYAASTDSGSVSPGFWFGGGAHAYVRMQVIGPKGGVRDLSGSVFEIGPNSCPGELLPFGAGPVTTTINWKAWEGLGTYTVKYKLLGKSDEVFEGTFETKVIIGEDRASTEFPQKHE